MHPRTSSRDHTRASGKRQELHDGIASISGLVLTDAGNGLLFSGRPPQSLMTFYTDCGAFHFGDITGTGHTQGYASDRIPQEHDLSPKSSSPTFTYIPANTLLEDFVCSRVSHECGCWHPRSLAFQATNDRFFSCLRRDNYMTRLGSRPDRDSTDPRRSWNSLQCVHSQSR